MIRNSKPAFLLTLKLQRLSLQVKSPESIQAVKETVLFYRICELVICAVMDKYQCASRRICPRLLSST